MAECVDYLRRLLLLANIKEVAPSCYGPSMKNWHSTRKYETRILPGS